MGNSASVSTAPSPPSSSSSTVGLNASQHQQLREAVALAEPDYIATIMQLIDDEGIVWVSTADIEPWITSVVQRDRRRGGGG